jgi:hypothetical protein
VPKAFEFVESFSKPTKLSLAGFQKQGTGALLPAFNKEIC